MGTYAGGGIGRRTGSKRGAHNGLQLVGQCQQKTFADNYIISGNATEAAIKAGYSEKMEEIGKAMNLAMEKFKEEYGENANLEDGDEFVTVFNNCVLIISLEDGKLSTKFIGGKPYEVDMTLGIYE